MIQLRPADRQRAARILRLARARSDGGLGLADREQRRVQLLGAVFDLSSHLSSGRFAHAADFGKTLEGQDTCASARLHF